ncbi:MAG: twin-arginine translocase TatA/TatE family subunit [Candidatus Omnitrophica bacterium]|nr:twin-arginine translocase TatA/TatE family subunit [Candidatus Omnitrophota bacterium]MCM8799654.1 twin-arginine translocase TatA/TatE family subunit [Candidatus Omnitrophota bacterium]
MRLFGIGLEELLVILLICLLIFGASKLPEIGRALGKTIREFKKAMKEEDEEQKDKT